MKAKLMKANGEVYNSEEAAQKIAAGDGDYITTIKVEWEE